MNKEEELENIRKEILILKRKKRKVFFYESRLPFYFKGGISLLTAIITIAFSSFSLLGAYYSINRDRIILWIILGLLGVTILFIAYIVTQKAGTAKQNKRIDNQINALKIKYEIVKGSR